MLHATRRREEEEEDVLLLHHFVQPLLLVTTNVALTTQAVAYHTRDRAFIPRVRVPLTDLRECSSGHGQAQSGTSFRHHARARGRRWRTESSKASKDVH